MLPTISPLSVSVLLVFSRLLSQGLCDTLLHTVSRSVGADNFTYFELLESGNILIVLDSLQGDADLYISDTTKSPDYYDYALQSVTCGQDEVLVTAMMKRPVTIGVYGHSSHEVSLYVLRLYQSVPPLTHSYSENGPDDTSASPPPQKKNPNRAPGGRNIVDAKEDEESVLWTIFVGILKVLFDVLV